MGQAVQNEADVLVAYQDLMKGRQEQMQAALKRLTDVKPHAGGQALLATLHHAELEACEAYRWPWYAWRSSNIEFPDLGLGAGSSPLEHEILKDVGRVRRGDLAHLERYFSGAENLLQAAQELQLPFQFELLLYAFLEKKWQIVKQLSGHILDAWQKGSLELHARMAELAFDMHLRAILRMGMSSFVNRPGEVIGQLDDLASNALLMDRLKEQTHALTYFEAARHAFSGEMKASVNLYNKANRQPGFRTPIFNAGQTLIPIDEVQDTSAEVLTEWFARYSSLKHCFRHEGAGQHAILVSCERHYFNRYARLYVEALGITNPGALVHFHLINMDSDESHTLDQLRAWETEYGIKLNCSFEQNRIMKEATPFTSGVAVTTRYIYLQDYLDKYSGVTLTDVDGCLTASVESVSDFKEADALISSWIWRKNTGHWRLPWANLAGGYISFRASDKTSKFVALLRKYLIIVTKNNVGTGRQLVYSDQAGVFLALKYGVRNWGHRVGFMPKQGFTQSFEQRLEFRSEGKRKAMHDKLAELQANKS